MRSRTLADSESGGITILVAFTLLVLLTVAAMGMSRNSLRQIMLAGTVRQGAEVMNTADAGLEWSLFWMYPPNSAGGGAVDAGQILFLTKLAELNDPSKGGIPTAVPTTGAEMNTVDPTGPNHRFDLLITQMGKVKPPGFSVQNVAFYPLAWSVRSNANVGPFQHSREMWLTTPTTNISNN